ncbi:jg10235 [Pararge aegeria aegeria]|uniref:Jg10235 protein n=1 Tax=Pararge aegeria aegeria TaxID=348720 RepID=A0A8S4S5H5_9NEOP|nr:jg10235 [Pararge aegeria aegeria]
MSSCRLWKVTAGRRGGGGAAGAGGRAARARLRVARGGGGGAGVVTQCDVSAPSARYAPALSSVAARNWPPKDAPYAPPPPVHFSHTGF